MCAASSLASWVSWRRGRGHATRNTPVLLNFVEVHQTTNSRHGTPPLYPPWTCPQSSLPFPALPWSLPFLLRTLTVISTQFSTNRGPCPVNAFNLNVTNRCSHNWAATKSIPSTTGLVDLIPSTTGLVDLNLNLPVWASQLALLGGFPIREQA